MNLNTHVYCALFPQAGFNAGDGANYLALPGSGTDAIRNLSSTSNVGKPGKWVYRVDSAEIISGSKSFSPSNTPPDFSLTLLHIN